jgi:hypothetical protein
MITVTEYAKDTTQDILEFKDEFGKIFVNDTKFRKELNKKLETNYRKVFVKKTDPSHVLKGGLMIMSDMYILTEKYRLLRFVTTEDTFMSEV